MNEKRKKQKNSIVETLEKEFPKFTKIQLCMVNNPQYGVWYSPRAARILRQKGILPVKSKPRAKNKEIKLHFDAAQYESIKGAVAATGCRSTQEFFDKLISENVRL